MTHDGLTLRRIAHLAALQACAYLRLPLHFTVTDCLCLLRSAWSILLARLRALSTVLVGTGPAEHRPSIRHRQ